MPGRHGFRCEPDRSTATLWQCLVVLVPVAHSIARLRDFVTTRFDGFKGHLISRTEAFALILSTLPRRHHKDLCTSAAFHCRERRRCARVSRSVNRKKRTDGCAQSSFTGHASRKELAIK